MACESIISVTKVCGSSLVPGSEKLWMVAFVDLNTVAGDEVYGVSASTGLINQIGLDTGKKFVSIGFLRDSASITSEGTVDPSRGVAFSTNTLTFKLADLTYDNQKFLETVMTQPVAAIVKLRTGKYYALGLSGQLQLSAFATTTGAGPADEVSYTLTFNEIDEIVPRGVDASLISTITA